ncbi:MAG: hypothetical protein CM1200mP18_08440 [Gammaproteobacteria bacterium]|nr:MAG: hypothetical protein CM1200mP18_08440 [Gammaproteobacteria bacterium]
MINQHASLDPARYHQGLYERTLASGCHVVDNCRVENIVRNADGFNLGTAKGQIRAGKVIVATSGYTGRQHHGTRDGLSRSALTCWQLKCLTRILRAA